jgi:hypothetical protein
MAISFSVLGRSRKYVSEKLLELHHDYAEKTVDIKVHDYFLWEHDYKFKN